MSNDLYTNRIGLSSDEYKTRISQGSIGQNIVVTYDWLSIPIRLVLEGCFGNIEMSLFQFLNEIGVKPGHLDDYQKFYEQRNNPKDKRT
jgi:hypothetical protein